MSTAQNPETERISALDVATSPGEGDGQWLVQVRGEVDVATSPQLKNELADLLSRDARNLVVDMGGVTFIDSSGLGVLVEMLERLQAQQGDAIVLRGMQEPVRRVFEITGLTELFTIEG
jgi:anti-sigma B factor antagonist